MGDNVIPCRYCGGPCADGDCHICVVPCQTCGGPSDPLDGPDCYDCSFPCDNCGNLTSPNTAHTTCVGDRLCETCQ